MIKITLLAAFCCLAYAGKIPRTEKPIHQIIQDAQQAEPVHLIVSNQTLLNLVSEHTKTVLKNNDFTQCSEDPAEKELTNWCYQNIARALGDDLNRNTEIGQKGHFTVTIGTTNRAFTYIENPPTTIDLLFSLDQLFVEIQWFQ